MIIIPFLLIFPSLVLADAVDLCDVIKIPNCRGITKQVRRSAFQSGPSTSTTANLNPANISFDKGIGLDMTAQENNKTLFGLTSGTGKMGGALITGSLDNSFFGNRAPELDEAIIDRHENRTQFSNEKLTVALGLKLFSKKNVGLDSGFIIKRHSLRKKINTGYGVSGRLSIFHFGLSTYMDDSYIDLRDYKHRTYNVPYSVLYGKDTLEERFVVNTYTVGMRIKNVSLDFGNIQSRLKFYDKEPTTILIYSASYNYKNLLLNVAKRKEESEALSYNSKGDLEVDKHKSDLYYGLQYSLNNHVILGAHHNYFLLDEYSFSLTIFL